MLTKQIIAQGNLVVKRIKIFVETHGILAEEKENSFDKDNHNCIKFRDTIYYIRKDFNGSIKENNTLEYLLTHYTYKGA